MARHFEHDPQSPILTRAHSRVRSSLPAPRSLPHRQPESVGWKNKIPGFHTKPGSYRVRAVNAPSAHAARTRKNPEMLVDEVLEEEIVSPERFCRRGLEKRVHAQASH